MKDYKKHLISEEETIKEVLLKLGTLEDENILFVVNENNQLVGSGTEGEVRRGLLNNLQLQIKLLILFIETQNLLTEIITQLMKLYF